MPLPSPTLLRDDYRLSTWLLTGACLQALLVVLLPRPLALLPPILLLATRALQTLLMATGLIHDSTRDNVRAGRQTARMPDADEKEVVVFVLGARSSHPLGRLAPGFMQTGTYFRSMWEDAEIHSEEYGLLGKSSILLGTDASAGNSLAIISYWKDLASLQRYAASALHREGWEWFLSVSKKWPHLGIMHEVYAVPKGSWENIYHNCEPFGMGQTKYTVEGEWRSALQEAKGKRWTSMATRMGREEAG